MDDGTTIEISRGNMRNGDAYEYSFICTSGLKLRERSSDSYSFSVDDSEKLTNLRIPRITLEIDGEKFEETKPVIRTSEQIPPASNKKIANALVCWAGKVIYERKYSPPPISISLMPDFPQG